MGWILSFLRLNKNRRHAQDSFLAGKPSFFLSLFLSFFLSFFLCFLHILHNESCKLMYQKWIREFSWIRRKLNAANSLRLYLEDQWESILTNVETCELKNTFVRSTRELNFYWKVLFRLAQRIIKVTYLKN